MPLFAPEQCGRAPTAKTEEKVEQNHQQKESRCLKREPMCELVETEESKERDLDNHVLDLERAVWRLFAGFGRERIQGAED